MDPAELLDLYDRIQRIEGDETFGRKEILPDVVRYVGGSGDHALNIVTYSRLTAANADAIIADQIAYFGGLGYSFEWKAYSHDQPPDLVDRLRRNGFAIGEVEALMALDLQEAPPALLAPITADVRRITDPAELDVVQAVGEAVWGGDRGGLRRWLAEEMRLTPDLLTVYVAHAGGRPAAAGWIRYDPRGVFAGLWGGSTVPDLRGRGLYTALVARRVQDAIARGFRFLTIDASPMSRPIVEKHGFKLLTYTYECRWEPPAAASA